MTTAVKIKLLAIDDAQDSLDTLSSAMPHIFPSAALLTAVSGRKGIELAQAEVPDVILLDIRMPGMDGFETCRRIKADMRLSHIPVVFLTAARPDEETCTQIFDAGGDAFVFKPFELWELAVQIRAMLKIKASNISQQAERAELRRLVAQRTSELEKELAAREKALESLKESETLFRTVFTESPLGICLVDSRTGRFLRVNPALAELTGRTEEQLCSLHWKDVTHPADIKPQVEKLAALASGAAEGLRPEKRYLRPDGGEIWAKLTISPLPSFGGADPRYMGLVEDISAARAAEQEKAQLEEQLRQSQKMETAGSLAGGIAHDFNNILSAILAYADFLLAGLAPGDPKRRDADEIKKAGLRAAALTRQLLAFSRKQVLQPKVMDVSLSITGIKTMLRRLLGENIKLATVLPKDPALINVDPGYLEQVLMNLSVNARDAMHKGGKLTLAAAPVRMDTPYIHKHGTLDPGDYIMLSVSDTGCGMDAETLSHIFEPFFTTKPRDKGTGLGLSTVHGIVKQSGGSIVVYSEKGHGTVFKIYFPRVPGEPEPAAPPPAVKTTGAIKGTVLVVDDEAPIRAVTRRFLAQEGLTVLEAASAEEALAVCKRRDAPVSLLLTDMVLPKMNGFELAERLKAQYPDMGVIYMSGYTDHSILSDGVLDPDKDFIQKPFALDALSSKVRRALPASAPPPPPRPEKRP